MSPGPDPVAGRGEVFLDARGNGRAMRLTWHHEADMVVLSLWRDALCAGTFRLARADVADFVDALVDGLRDDPGVHLSSPPAAAAGPAHRGPGAPAASSGPDGADAADAPSQPLQPVGEGPSYSDEPTWTGQVASYADEPTWTGESAPEQPSFVEWAFEDVPLQRRNAG